MAEKPAGEEMSNRRDIVLQSLAKAHRAPAPLPELAWPVPALDLLASFIARAKASAAQVHEISSSAEVPLRIAEILRASVAPLELHIPTTSPLNELPWRIAPELSISAAPPPGGQSALAAADYGIAETGTLVFCSGAKSPSSWHFRPGREFILVERSRILPGLEDVITAIATSGAMPATVNLVTGPSRTADIEQTIELGAHGPREVHILIAG
jgi:L-lactate dehydrogenase complex protein LldG